MTPKKPSASKKQKTTDVSSSGTRRNFDATRFLGPDQQARFRDLEKRTIWSEKQFLINPQGENRVVYSILERRKWDKLLDPPTNLNVDIVREFYANAMPIEDEPYHFKTFVRGKHIRFDRNALNEYLGNPLNLPPDHLCAYSETLARQNWPVENMSRNIFIEGGSFELNATGHEKRAIRDTLTTPAQVILLLILYNLKPRSHTYSAPMDYVTLLWYILAGLQVDIARDISNEMRSIAESGINNNSKPVLTYPGLSMGLCSAARVHLPAQVHKVISGPINDAYIKRYCKSKRAQQQQQPQAPQPPIAQEPPAQAYPPIDPNLQTWLQHPCLQNTAGFRAMTAVHDSIYKYQQQQQVMTPPEFQNYVAWPGDMPHFTGGAGTSTAAGYDAGDDPIDVAAADAVNDDEDAMRTMEGDDNFDKVSE